MSEPFVDPFADPETQLTVVTRHSGQFRFTLPLSTALTVMTDVVKITDDIIVFNHSGGVALFEVREVVHANVHGKSIKHSEELLTELREKLK